MEDKTIIGFSKLIKNYRKDKKITQEKLGDILDRNQGTISNYEKSIHFPNNPEEIKAIAALLNQPVSYVIDSIEFSRSGIIERHEPLLINLDELSEYNLQKKYRFMVEDEEITFEELEKMLYILRFERFIRKQGLKSE